MSFGPIMQVQAGKLTIELAPLEKEHMQAIISPGMQQASVTRYLGRGPGVPSIEDEHEWYETVRKDKSELVWGIWVGEGKERKLIGTSALKELEPLPLYQATSGVLIADKTYWGKGIATHIHKARTWYAFKHMGLVRIKSGVIHGNAGSLKALQRSGYNLVYVERNVVFVDGNLHHVDCLECLNPADSAWRQWWGGDRPTKSSKEARIRTLAAMEWAEKNVVLL